MNPSVIDVTLALARMTILLAIACLLGRFLTRRRPDVIASLTVPALIASFLLLFASGMEMPITWQSAVSISSTTQQQPIVNTDANSPLESHDVGSGYSWSAIKRLLAKLERDGSRPRFVTESLGILIFIALVTQAVLRVVFGSVITILLHNSSRNIESLRLIKLVDKLPGAVNIPSTLSFRVSEAIESPCVTAWDRTCIYLPSSWSEMSDQELTTIIAHELAHLERGDARTRLIAQFAFALQSFHPLSRVLYRQLVIGQELAADARAASTVGRTNYLQGLSHLALRLDRTAHFRHPSGLGMSSSSSGLIRRIEMLRNGNGNPVSFTHGKLTGCIFAVMVAVITGVLATWTVAEEQIRVAARTDDAASSSQSRAAAQPWEIMPGRDGYWELNVNLIRKHPVVSQWLESADRQFLETGWKLIAQPNAYNKRSELGLGIENVARLAGSATMMIQFNADSEPGKQHTLGFKSNDFIFQSNNDIEWKAISEVIDASRINAMIAHFMSTAGLVERTPGLDDEQEAELLTKGIYEHFLLEHTNPKLVVIEENSKKERPATSPAIPIVWGDSRGELVTFAVRLPESIGTTESKLDKATEAFHQAVEFYACGVSPTPDPETLSVRFRLSPRENVSAAELVQCVENFLDVASEDLQTKQAANAEDGAFQVEILNMFSNIKTTQAPGLKNSQIVIMETAISADVLSKMIFD